MDPFFSKDTFGFVLVASLKPPFVKFNHLRNTVVLVPSRTFLIRKEHVRIFWGDFIGLENALGQDEDCEDQLRRWNPNRLQICLPALALTLFFRLQRS